jgi:hypothetical protein
MENPSVSPFTKREKDSFMCTEPKAIDGGIVFPSFVRRD